MVWTHPPVDNDNSTSGYTTSATMVQDTSEQSREISISGIKIKISATPREVTTEEVPLYPKEQRNALTQDKRNDLFEKASKEILKPKFDLISLNLNDEDKLDDTYNVGIQIAKMRSHFIRFDMHGVFTIVKPTNGGELANDSANFIY